LKRKGKNKKLNTELNNGKKHFFYKNYKHFLLETIMIITDFLRLNCDSNLILQIVALKILFVELYTNH